MKLRIAALLTIITLSAVSASALANGSKRPPPGSEQPPTIAKTADSSSSLLDSFLDLLSF
ncbi:hypothetical protein EYS14_12865 [Alteromonadaceae bacterium M269]|nr:hypothetical protein EYS14_12865 [Alteromonadaceae bacterium M269]